jgi:hypothetical protein
MENQVSFPPGCEVVGQVSVFDNGPFREDILYVKGNCPENVRLLGRVMDVVDGKSGVETKVNRFQGPSNYFYG